MPLPLTRGGHSGCRGEGHAAGGAGGAGGGGAGAAAGAGALDYSETAASRGHGQCGMHIDEMEQQQWQQQSGPHIRIVLPRDTLKSLPDTGRCCRCWRCPCGDCRWRCRLGAFNFGCSAMATNYLVDITIYIFVALLL